MQTEIDPGQLDCAANIQQTVQHLNTLMEEADALGMTVSIAPKTVTRSLREPLRQINCRVSVDLVVVHSSDDVAGATGGRQ